MGGVVTTMRVGPGLRIGFWAPGRPGGPFIHKGFYTGPELGDHIPGSRLEQKLFEGDLKFRVGVLFRPDLGPRQNLETILILENYFEEMWNYETWDQAIG